MSLALASIFTIYTYDLHIVNKIKEKIKSIVILKNLWL